MQAPSLSAAGPRTITTAENGWWETARLRLLVETVVSRTTPGIHMDVGCGRGTIAAAIAACQRPVVAVDAHLFPEWRDVAGVSFVVASADQLPFRDGAFTSTSAFDVIEHLPDDATALTELNRVTAPKGTTVVSVPAFEVLWSVHDENVGHHRRYDRTTLSARLAAVGYRVRWSSYFFTFLVPPAWLFRRRAVRSELPYGRFAMLSAPVVSLLCSVERFAVRRRRLPFGTSLVAVSDRQRPGAPDA
jgi:SAM-dependent methyltransferase